MRPNSNPSAIDCLGLPPGDEDFVKDASNAIWDEYRRSVRWKKCRCRSVTKSAGSESIFILDVGHAIEFDWTWEGAVAFRPRDLSGSDHGDPTIDEWRIGDREYSSWSGEVVEVDETNGRLYVSVYNTDCPPFPGRFWVRPFEFLTYLNQIFNCDEGKELRKQLPPRLHAVCGGHHPRLKKAPTSGLPELARLWQHSWGILWGPPGTGKTTTLGKQVAECLKERKERILVVSTTNKATDAAALAIGRSLRELAPDRIDNAPVRRIGKGATYSDFQKVSLEILLRDTEIDLLVRIEEKTRERDKTPTTDLDTRARLNEEINSLQRRMKDNAFNLFVNPKIDVIVCTAFKAMALLNNDEIKRSILNGEHRFTTVIIDEAGLIGRATAAALSLHASERVLFAGDAKQLAPISKVSRVLPPSQAKWLASSSLSHLQRVTTSVDGVHLLNTQFRMHPDISKVVSKYQYDGFLIDAPEVKNRNTPLPSILRGQPRAIWYVLDEDTEKLADIRPERGPGNKSWIRPRARDILKKLFDDPEMRTASGMFITPFKAQAKDIVNYFAEGKRANWSAGTVHARQGIESDIIIFDTVNAGSTGWQEDEWRRLINVGISRAKELVLLLASRNEMNQPYLSPLRDLLAPRVLDQKHGKPPVWRTVEATLRPVVAPGVEGDPSRLGSQITRRKSLRPVMSHEQQQLCDLKLDGGPRLVRGVAGRAARPTCWPIGSTRHARVWKASRTLPSGPSTPMTNLAG